MDTSAYARVLADTAAAYAPGGSGSCATPCDSSGVPQAGCCDGVWLPSLEMPNFLMKPGVSYWRRRIRRRWSIAHP